MPEIDLERSQREEARWRVLRALDAGRPAPVSETVIHRTLADIELPVSPAGLRRELTYLADKGLVTIVDQHAPTWVVKLTSYGVDVVEYSTDAPTGIARPRKFW